MTLPIPFPVYGEVKDSNNNSISGATIIISGSTSTTLHSRNDGKYMYNIQNIRRIFSMSR